MGLAPTPGRTNASTLDLGTWENDRAQEASAHIQTAADMKEISKTILRRAEEPSSLKMEAHIWASGRTISRMARESSPGPTAINSMASGIKERVRPVL